MRESLRVGSRGSPLALAQTEEVLGRLRALNPGARVETVVIKTHGDEGYRTDLGSTLDGKRAFTKRIEDALLGGRIDFAVHSLKDLPAELVSGLSIAAVPSREDPRDALVANARRTLADLSPKSRVGTSSLRRRAQLLASRSDLEIAELHGNVGTRLRRLAGNEFDAVVVAAAGIRRLRLEPISMEPIDPGVVTPAPGQGALAVEVRADDDWVRDLLAPIDDPTSRRATEAERALSARLGGGCNIPFGALASIEASRLRLQAVVADPDGRRVVRTDISGPAHRPDSIAEQAYRRLLDDGAGDLLEEVA
jgi:hydroxymethylbilane synthase